MKKKYVFLIFFLLECIISAQEPSNDFIFKQIELSEENTLDKNILEHYGNLWISYKKADTPCIFSKTEIYPIPIINFYYKKNDSYFFLGKIDINGIYDKNYEKLCNNTLKKERFKNFTVLGFAETTDIPFNTSQLYKNNETGKYGCSEPYAFFTIDFETNSLKLIHVRE